MAVEMVRPHPDCLPAGLLAGTGAGEEHLIGEQTIEPLDLPNVSGRMR